MNSISSLKKYQLSRKELATIGAGEMVCTYSFSYYSYVNGEYVMTTQVYGSYWRAQLGHAANIYNPTSITENCSTRETGAPAHISA